MKIVVSLVAALVLGGCASLSEHECRTADWESIGYIDGSRGYDAGRIASHAESCAEYAIQPDRDLYEEGRGRGLETFCTGQNGVRLGRQGYSYNGVCPRTLEPAFLAAFDFGRSLHEVDVHMNDLRSEIQRVQSTLQRKDPPLSERDRDYLLYRLRDLEREYGRSEAELRRLEMEGRQYD